MCQYPHCTLPPECLYEIPTPLTWYCKHFHKLQRPPSRRTLSMSAESVKLWLPFETMDIAFQMPNGDIIRWPTCITSINGNIGNVVLIATNVMYKPYADNINHSCKSKEGFVIFSSSCTLRVTTKSNPFNKTLNFYGDWNTRPPRIPMLKLKNSLCHLLVLRQENGNDRYKKLSLQTNGSASGEETFWLSTHY